MDESVAELKVAELKMADLQEAAEQAGVSRVSLIAAADIVVDDSLAQRCLEPRCENYGQSCSCPPHVGGPSQMREWLSGCSHALVFTIEVPTDILYSNQAGEVFQLLHQAAARLEQKAHSLGYSQARGFAGGSCKKLFCENFHDCAVLTTGKEQACRNPDQARPSMSGFGIDVAKLFALAGWKSPALIPPEEREQEKTANVTGLVLLG